MHAIEMPSLLHLRMPGNMVVPTMTMTASWNKKEQKYQAMAVQLEHLFNPITGRVMRDAHVRNALRDENMHLLARPALKSSSRARGRALSLPRIYAPNAP